MTPFRRARLARALAGVLLLAACRGTADSTPDQARAAGAPAAAPGAATGRPKIVVLGDSLSAGLGVAPSQAYPALLQKKIDGAGLNWEVVNAGISGDTTAAGRQRLDWAIDLPDVKILVVELGANDGLRGLPVDQMKANLAAIIEHAQARHIAVLLTGMEAPPNFGPEYVVSFRQAYRDLANKYNVPLLPFLLDKVAGVPSLNQADGIHPNVEGAAIVADNVWAMLEPMVKAAPAA